MKKVVIITALLAVALAVPARKNSDREEGERQQNRDRESTAESQDRKSSPTPMPPIQQPTPDTQPATPVPHWTPQPTATPQVAKQKGKKGSEAERPRPEKSPKENNKQQKQDAGKRGQADQGKKNNKDRNPPPPMPVEPLTHDSDLPDPEEEIGEPISEQSIPVQDTPSVSYPSAPEPSPESVGPNRHRRPGPRPTPAPASLTPYIPTGTPPSDSSVTPTPVATVLPRPVITPARTPKPLKEKKRRPKPTPGVTPVPTPATVTPTPTDFLPGPNWQPPPGWVPPAGWQPPTGWFPPGGWTPPPGWRPPKDWVLRLYRWGWTWVPKRGWVCPPRWVPPRDFVCPPGWYYLPRHDYTYYDVYDPVEIAVTPGIARPDLVQQIIVSQPYTPSEEVAEEIYDEETWTEEEEEADTEALERPMPESPPELERSSDVDDIIRMLSRGYDPVLRYAGPVFATQRIQFEDEGYAILPQSFETLDAIGAALLDPALETALISIESHLNDSLDDAPARTLTRRRAWAVKGYLVQKFGLDPERLVYVGYGNDAPIAPHDSDDGLAMNERVEIENVTDLFASSGAGMEEEPEITESETSESLGLAPMVEEHRSTGTLHIPISSIEEPTGVTDVVTSSVGAADTDTSVPETSDTETSTSR